MNPPLPTPPEPQPAHPPAPPTVQTHIEEGDWIHLSMHPASPDSPTQTSPGGADTPTQARLQLPLPNIAGFEILGELGRGGMGVVYKARQTKLHRIVALKMILASEHADASQVRRFLAEAETVAKLQHPNIVQVYEVGTHEHLPYFVLEYVEGGNLHEQLHGQPYPPKATARFIATVARAVHFAHEQGIIHRDLKPANILLSLSRVPEPRVPENLTRASGARLNEALPKITDFGLAKQLGSQEGLTKSNQVLGTPAYMAPEQAQGHRRDLGPGADVYSLGAMLYELLCGQPPFKGAGPVETMMLVLSSEAVSVSKLQPRVPADLATICMKCLEKEPHRRYRTAADLADDLERYLRDEPIQARRIGELEKFWKWAKRRPAIASLLLIILLMLVAGITISTSFGIDAHQQAQIAAKSEAEAVTARDQARTAEAEAVATRRESQRQNARLLLEKGVQLAEENDPSSGIHWMLASLRQERELRPEFVETVRRNLTAWDSQIPRLAKVLELPDSARAVAIHPEGHILATAAADRRVYLWDRDSGKLLRQTPVMPSIVSDMAFSPDGKTFVTGMRHINQEPPPYIARQWDTATCQETGPPITYSRQLHCIRFAPDGKTIVSGHDGGALCFWNASTGQLIGTPLPHPYAVRGVAFSPDGKLLAAAVGNDGPDLPGSVQLWNVSTRQPHGPAHPHRLAVLAVVFHPDSRSFFAGGNDCLIVHRDTATGQQLGDVLRHPVDQAIRTLGITPDGALLVSCGHDGKSRVWDVRSGKQVAELLHSNSVDRAALSKDGHFLLTAPNENAARLWLLPELWSSPAPLRQDRLQRAARNRPGETPIGDYLLHPSRLVAFRHDRQAVLASNGGRIAWLLDTNTGQPLTPPLRHLFNIRAVAYSPNGKYVATCCHGLAVQDSSLQVWDAATGQPLGRPLQNNNYISALAFSPDGQRLAFADYSLNVRFLEIPSGKIIAPAFRVSDIPLSMTMSPDGKLLAVGTSGDYTQKPHVELWELPACQRVGAAMVHSSWVDFLQFSPDGKTLFSGGREAQLWEVPSGKPRGPPFAGEQHFYAGVFSPDGSRIAIGCIDGTVELWDVARHTLAGPPLRMHHHVSAMRFSDDGRLLAVGCRNGLFRLWDTATFQPIGPSQMQHLPVWGIVFTPDGQAVRTVGEDGGLRSWSVPVPTAESLPALALRWENVTSRKLNASGESLRIFPWKEWLTLPPAPAMPPRFSATWHEARAREAEQANDVHAALWHLDQVLRQDTREWHLWARRARMLVLAERYDEAAADLQRVEHLGGKQARVMWQEHCALDSMTRSQWTAALWHLDHLLAEPQPTWEWSADRAAVQAQLERWDACEVDLLKALERGGGPFLVARLAEQAARNDQWQPALRLYRLASSRGGTPFYPYALASLQAGDKAQYRQVCTTVLQRFGTTADPQTIVGISNLCSLGPDGLADYTPLIKKVEAILAKFPENEKEGRHILLGTLGALLYRAGRHQEAITRLEQAFAVHGRSGIPANHLFLIMARLRLGKTADARAQWLTYRRLEPQGNGRFSWELVEQGLLQKEAEEMLGKVP